MKNFILHKPVWITVMMITLFSSLLGLFLVPLIMISPSSTFLELSLVVVIPSFFISLFISLPVVYFYKKIIKENHQLIQDLQKDFLTGFLNRHAFYDRYYNLIETLKKNQQSISLLMIDLDDFKEINDFYGHSAGDEVIQYSANLIQNYLGEEDLACRFGGEEFLIVFANISQEQAIERGNSILTIMDATYTYKQKQITYTGSIGLVYSNASYDSEELINIADGFMYQAKAEGKNRLVYNTIPPSTLNKSSE